MTETAATPLPDTVEVDARSDARERLGVAAFVVVAVVATTTWIVLLAYGAIKLIGGI